MNNKVQALIIGALVGLTLCVVILAIVTMALVDQWDQQHRIIVDWQCNQSTNEETPIVCSKIYFDHDGAVLIDTMHYTLDQYYAQWDACNMVFYDDLDIFSGMLQVCLD